jgi:hypothetical protein
MKMIGVRTVSVYTICAICSRYLMVLRKCKSRKIPLLSALSLSIAKNATGAASVSSWQTDVLIHLFGHNSFHSFLSFRKILALQHRLRSFLYSNPGISGRSGIHGNSHRDQTIKRATLRILSPALSTDPGRPGAGFASPGSLPDTKASRNVTKRHKTSTQKK